VCHARAVVSIVINFDRQAVVFSLAVSPGIFYSHLSVVASK
jgi:hypothetical protein